MSATGDFRLALVAALAAALPDTQMLAGPPAENSALRESLWIADNESEWDWRSLGPAQNYRRNRKEQIVITLSGYAYREGPNQMQTLALLDARVDDMITDLEHAVADDPEVAGTCTYALIKSVRRTPQEAPNGWVVNLTVRVVAEVHPTS